MKDLHLVHLANFKDDVNREIRADALSRPNPMSDKEFFLRLVAYGNDYLEAGKARYPGCTIFFDIHWDRPDGLSTAGMTWAFNPRAAPDAKTNGAFWRAWTQTEQTDEFLISFEQLQQEFQAYILEGLV